MPEAKHDLFCPQCGSLQVLMEEKDDEGVQVRRFMCGETIRGNETSYTCHTVPARARAMERALEDAKTMLASAPLPVQARNLIRQMKKNPHGRIYGSLGTSGRVLTRYRIIDLGTNSVGGYAQLTEFGHVVADMIGSDENV